MDAGILEPLVSYAASILILAALTLLIAIPIVWLTKLQGNVYYHGLRSLLIRLRTKHFQAEALVFRPRVLKQLAHEEALQLLAGAPLEEPEGRSTVVGRLPRWGIDLPAQIECALSYPEVLADFKDQIGARQRAAGRRSLLRHSDLLHQRFRRILLALATLSALPLAFVLRFSTVDLFEAIRNNTSIWLIDSCATASRCTAFSLAAFAAEPHFWKDLLGILITALICGAIAAMWINRAVAHVAAMSASSRVPYTPPPEAGATGPSSPHPPGAPTGPRTIGRTGDHIRAINFSSGAFDTLMHLGVIHALVVIHGRAPDIVTGLSAGAVHAAALAEVLQAGEESERRFRETQPEGPLSPAQLASIQDIRLRARVERLRRFIDAAHRAPERLLEAVLPDAYQIDVGRPLQPLQQPSFSKEEREDRAAFVSSRSGLAALYNDVLSIPLTIGTLTKIARRILGIVGAGAIPSGLHRGIIRAIESLRLWVLFGVNLGSMARLTPIFAKAFRPPRKPNPATASALIFRSRFFDYTIRYGSYVLSFFVLAAAWLILSTIAFPFAFIATVPLLFAAWRYRSDPLSRSVAKDGIQGMFAWFFLLLAWFTAALLLYAFTHPAAAILPGAIIDPNAMLHPGTITSATALFDAFHHNWLNAYIDHLLLAFFIVLLVIFVIAWDITTHRYQFHERLLASYNLGDAIFKDHGLRAFIAELFDRDYYTKPSIKQAVKAGLEYTTATDSSDTPAPTRHKLEDYRSPNRNELERIHIALAVANTETGDLEVVPQNTAIIDGIMAATAVTPLLPPVELPVLTKEGDVRNVLYVDGVNVTREPTHALLKTLRRRHNPDSLCTYIYSVEPFPISKPALGEALSKGSNDDDDPVTTTSAPRTQFFLNLVDIAWRAMRLRRFRDATLERRLTELFTTVLPRPGEPAPPEVKEMVRAWVTPIELEYDADLNARLSRASKENRRKMIERTVADGCRAALQVMIPDAISAVADVSPQPLAAYSTPENSPKFARCSAAVKAHFHTRKSVPDTITHLPFPGSNPDLGPGLSEICASCRLGPRALQPTAAVSASDRPNQPAQLDQGIRASAAHQSSTADEPSGSASNIRWQTLRLDGWAETGPSWPHELEPVRAADRNDKKGERRFRQPESLRRQELQQAWKAYKAQIPAKQLWPHTRGPKELGDLRHGSQRPTISLLFSGGVFRGVFQVGVLNGLHELGLKPDLIAGASVGSITAAMIARAFTITASTANTQRNPTTQSHASTQPDAGADRLDRDQPLADRARRDTSGAGVTDTDAAREAANRIVQQEHIAWLAATYLGIDRLVLTDRFSDFVRNVTLRASETRFSIRQADRVFRRYDSANPWTFNRDARRVIGGLERLLYISPYQLNDLIRSMRTRASRELAPQLSERVQQFLDRMQIGEEALGAEPLRALVDDMGVATAPGQTPPIVTADDLRNETGLQFLATTTNLTQGSLEVLGEISTNPSESIVLNEALFASSAFPGVFRPRWSWELTPSTQRVQQYIDGGVMDNFPVDAIAEFLNRAAAQDVGLVARVPAAPHLIVAASLELSAPQYSLPFTRRRFRASWLKLRERAKQLGYNSKLDTYLKAERDLRHIDAQCRPNAANGIVHLQLLPIKPNWLCGTFAFHPMLGFRRDKQASSIAHGCAATLLAFADEYQKDSQPFKHWQIDAHAVPEVSTWAEAFERLETQKPDPDSGLCWLRNRPCPFSRKYLSETHPNLPLSVVNQVAKIHENCVRPETHLRQI